MSTNNFKPEKFYDFEIVDGNNRAVGKVRVKPSGILWKSKRARNWLGVSLDKFADFMKENGKEKQH